ncbi:hypothetical protein Mp_4g08060 [Marchantia polymorpha subsp. ruderalis]|uniref:Uncharacterized protein n=2 Tax=Marchantia polymorpha TaxID=3197 RepID=A0AAF6B7M7_MARPO|nr:hypothetical protein MARPO_0120s0037 [Marchantia polymorpha]BBN08011.1 hypothetical protein Mp_4g08060 [Marchantia polymorpha subsp. ruderalis]|eukprot:PTQ30761.1 hypothetical protein MARPO_0120s0037 [Marchantia polymorpha]
MVARIEQLDQRLAAMASSGAGASISHEGEYLSYLAMTRGVARALGPRGANRELDPQRGEGGRQARLPQSFLLSEVDMTSSMSTTLPSDHVVRTEASTSHVVGAETSSTAAIRMANLVMRSPLFSATKVMASGVDVARVFRVATTLCECGSVSATSAEIREGTVEEQLSTPTLRDEKSWQAAAAKMELLPARPAIDRKSIVLGVCMMDNRSGLFHLVSSTWQVYVPARVLIDSDA